MKYIILLFICFVTIKLFPQQNLNPIPASPNVAELGKYGAWPVDYYHGLPQINIPLYDLKVGDLSLPISLSYHASGIKVDEEASWVGLGWSLNAGGVITRQIKGADDFKTGKITVKTFEEIENGNIPTLEDAMNIKPSPDNCSPQQIKDAQSDIFSYNFAGYSGQFVLENLTNRKYKIHFLTNNDGLIIDDIQNFTTIVNNDTVTAYTFRITDKKGVKYYFNKYEICNPVKNDRYTFRFYDPDHLPSKFNEDGMPFDLKGNMYGCGAAYVSSWFLTKIQSPNEANSITFEYASDTAITTSEFSATIYYDLRRDLDIGWTNYPHLNPYESGQGPVSPGPVESTITLNYSLFNTHTLTSIIASNGTKINFTAKFKRKDLIDGLNSVFGISFSNDALSKVEIFFDTKPIKKWEFEYEYFGSSITTQQVNYINSDAWNWRLKLKRLKQFDRNGSINLNPYEFNYFGEGAGDPKMPFRGCATGSDNYGYLNSNSVSLSDAVDKLKLFPNVSGHIKKTLDKIGYMPAWTLIQGQGWPGISPYFYPYQYHLSHLTGFSFDWIFDGGSNITPNIDCAKTYTLKTIKYPTGGNSSFDYELNVYHKSAIKGNHEEWARYGGGLRLASMKDSPGEGSEILKTYSYNNSGAITYEQQWGSPYRFDVSPAITLNFIPEICGVRLSNTPWQNSNPVGYGLVTETSNEGSIEFSFTTPRDFPAEYNSRYLCGGYDEIGDNPYGISVVYEFIEPHPDHLDQYEDRSYYNGKPTGKSIYDKFGNPIQAIRNEYKFIDDGYIYQMSIAPLRAAHNSNTLNITRIPIGRIFLDSTIVYNYFNDANENLIWTTEKTAFVYDTENELLLEELKTNSLGEEKVTRYKYPIHYKDDFTGYASTDPNTLLGTVASAIYKQIENNIISAPVEQVTYIKNSGNNKILNGQVVIYNTFPSVTTPMPSEIIELNTSMPISQNVEQFLSKIIPFPETAGPRTFYELSKNGKSISIADYYSSTVNFDTYDANGNLLQYHKENDIRTSYIWNYNKTFPVAKIENSGLPAACTSFETSNDKGNWTYSGIATYSLIAKTGFYYYPLSSGNITKALSAGTYKLEYFAKAPVTIGGVTTINTQTLPADANGWIFYTKEVSSTGSTLSISGSTSIDELRLYPVDAQMTTYTYDPLIGMTSETDPNGKTTYYEYDGFGRLQYVRDNEGKVLKRYEYNYANQAQ